MTSSDEILARNDGEFYKAFDMDIAYLLDGDDNIVARAIIHEDKYHDNIYAVTHILFDKMMDMLSRRYVSVPFDYKKNYSF